MDSYLQPWTVAGQVSLFMRFSRQEYWGGLPCPPPGDFPDLDIEPISCTVGGFLTVEPPGKTKLWTHIFNSLVDTCGRSQAISLFNEEIKMIFFPCYSLESCPDVFDLS